MMACNRKRLFVVMAIALVALACGLIAVLAFRVSNDTPSGTSHFPWIVFLPIYTSLIPIYIGAARRRREKNKNG